MANTPSPSASANPADDPGRALTVADANGAGVPHISVAGGIYTVLVSGAQTAGRYCLIDMLVPAGGGPPPHRHDFEEMFTLLEGELEFTFRGKSHTVRTGSTVNVPPTPRTRSRTCPARRPVCSVCVRRRDRTNSSWRSDFPSKAAHRHRRSQPRRRWPRKAN